MDFRQQHLTTWLKHRCQLPQFEMVVLPSDASFRRYFRIKTSTQSYIAMDAPPERENNCQAFVAIATSLREQGLQAPQIFTQDIEQGFLLLSDFGDDLYLHVLKKENAEALYGAALNALAELQKSKIHNWKVPAFTADFMYQELELCKEWFLQKHLGLDVASYDHMLDSFFTFLATSAANQTQVLMHRDYHSANLLVLPNSEVGILDFQDAFIGPVTYDLVSLLRDCYIAWPDDMVKKLVGDYKNKLNLNAVSNNEFLRWFDLTGMQRHLKALLTFSRKFHRDNNSNYLQHIPRTINYLATVAPHYEECRAFNEFLHQTLLPAVKKVQTCAQ